MVTAAETPLEDSFKLTIQEFKLSNIPSPPQYSTTAAANYLTLHPKINVLPEQR